MGLATASKKFSFPGEEKLREKSVNCKKNTLRRLLPQKSGYFDICKEKGRDSFYIKYTTEELQVYKHLHNWGDVGRPCFGVDLGVVNAFTIVTKNKEAADKVYDSFYQHLHNTRPHVQTIKKKLQGPPQQFTPNEWLDISQHMDRVSRKPPIVKEDGTVEYVIFLKHSSVFFETTGDEAEIKRLSKIKGDKRRELKNLKDSGVSPTSKKYKAKLEEIWAVCEEIKKLRRWKIDVVQSEYTTALNNRENSAPNSQDWEYWHKEYKVKQRKFLKLNNALSQTFREFVRFIGNTLIPLGDVYIENLQGLTQKNDPKPVVEEKPKKIGRVRPITRRKMNNTLMTGVAREWKNIAKRIGGVVICVPAPYTSSRCNECGYIDKDNRPKQAVFECQECEHKENADVNAAMNIRDMGSCVVQEDNILDKGPKDPLNWDWDKASRLPRMKIFIENAVARKEVADKESKEQQKRNAEKKKQKKGKRKGRRKNKSNKNTNLE